ncbi:hypothetical protein RJ639_005854 [Escallonia herrerae]|uniref:Uncharacterized protein n=1 Tax=Escallonia herrerae TaxID=1293975 RepID=A0AA88VW49_9ASTE|nr:hypothetical protein RJ639_005854 [Escallonia herrerae]
MIRSTRDWRTGRRHAKIQTFHVARKLDVNSLLQHLLIEIQSTISRTNGSKLTQHDVLGNTPQVDRQRRGFYFFGNINDFPQPRNTKSDILGTNTSIVEVKCLTSKPVLIQHPLTCKRAAKENVEKESGILLSFHAHRIITGDNLQPLLKLINSFHNLHRMHIRRSSQVNLKCLLCIPDKPLEIHRHRPRIITSGSNLRSQLESICFKFLDFCIKHIAELPNCFQILNMFWQHVVWVPLLIIKLIPEHLVKLGLLHFKSIKLLIGNCVSNPNTETILQKPVVNKPLGMAQKFSSSIRANLLPVPEKGRPDRCVAWIKLKMYPSSQKVELAEEGSVGPAGSSNQGGHTWDSNPTRLPYLSCLRPTSDSVYIPDMTKKYLISEYFGAIKANATHNTENGLQKPDVEHRLCQLEVPKMAGALSHVGHTSLALELPVNGAQPRVTQSVRLRLPALRRLAVLNSEELCALPRREEAECLRN